MLHPAVELPAENSCPRIRVKQPTDKGLGLGASDWKEMEREENGKVFLHGSVERPAENEQLRGGCP